MAKTKKYTTCRILCLQADGSVFDAVLNDAATVDQLLVDGLHISVTGQYIPFPEEGKEYAELVDSNGKKFSIVRFGDQVQ